MHRLGIDNAGDTQRKADWYKNIGPKGMAWEVSKYRKAAALGKEYVGLILRTPMPIGSSQKSGNCKPGIQRPLRSIGFCPGICS